MYEARTTDESCDRHFESKTTPPQNGSLLKSHNDVITASLPVAPDGGWGWIVCAGAFTCMVLMDGILFSFGVFFLELQSFFGESKSRTAFVGSLQMGMSMMGGPLVSIMVNAWGPRIVAVVGVFVAVISFCVSTFAPNITILTFTYGFMGGFGICMVYLPTIIIIGFYFDKKRALANGITSSGSGIGAFLYAPLCNSLQREYGWKGALLILAAITLNGVVCGALFRPLKLTRFRSENNPCKSKTTLTIEIGLGPESDDQGNDKGDAGQEEPVDRINGTHAHPTILRLKNSSKSHSAYDVRSSNFSDKTIPTTFLPRSRTRALSPTAPQEGAVNASSQTSSYGLSQDDVADHVTLSCSHLGPTMHHETELNSSRHDRCHKELLKPLSRKDIFYSGSLLRIPEYIASNNSISVLYSTPHIDSDSDDGSFCHQQKHMCSKISKSLRRTSRLPLLRSPTLYLCIFSCILWTAHSSILTLLPDYAVQQGISNNNAALVLSVIGVSNTVARILAGWISDHPRVDCIWVNTTALLLGSAVCVAIAYTKTLSLLAMEACVFGLCMGTWTSLRPIILVDLLGIDNLTNSLGLLAMFQGAAFCIGPPITGALYDHIGSYRPGLFGASLAFLTSGIVSLLLRRVMACQR